MAEGEVRNRIISEAARIFADLGYTGASIQDIVDAAGTTKPMVYYYFQSKEGLYQEVFRTYNEWVTEAQREVVSDQALSTREKLVQLVDIHFDAVRESPDRARFMFAAHFGPRKAMPSLAEDGDEDVFFGTIVSLATEGVASGDLKGDPLLISQALLGQILIHLAFHLSEAKPVSLTDDAAERVVDQLILGVGGSP
jgi:TetR/AcrR family transcriptional regulator